ncbi:MAG: hypothetical protein ACRCV9_18140 [Burkholderiaceae bacterium]
MLTWVKMRNCNYIHWILQQRPCVFPCGEKACFTQIAGGALLGGIAFSRQNDTAA